MTECRNYTIVATFSSPLGSKLQSDTIFGSICWAIRYLEGKEALLDFLKLYGESVIPPLLVSNGFPLGFLPKPIVPPVTQEEIQVVLDREEDDRIVASHKVSAIRKLDLVPKDILGLFQHAPITPSGLFSAIYRRYDSIAQAEQARKTVAVQHNTIDRIKGRARAGRLFTQEETFFDTSSASAEIYLKTTNLSLPELTKIMEYISIEGLGRDGSVGNGHFDFRISEGIDAPQAERPNAFMTLASYIPTTNDPTRGCYGLVQKYGKLGGLYAKGVKEVFGNPFKVPLIMFSAGSTFFDKDYNGNKVYGSLVDHVHQNADIRHYAYAFPLGINIEVQDENI